MVERLGDVREILFARWKIALTFLARGRPLAATLLQQALTAAESMRIPEANTIRAHMRDHGLA